MSWFQLDLPRLQRHIRNRISVDHTASPDSFETRSAGPIHIRKSVSLPAGSSRTEDAIPEFIFVFPGQDTPLTFTYQPDLLSAIDDFLEDFDLDMDYAMPIHMAVNAGMGASNWAFGFEESSRTCTTPGTGRNVAFDQITTDGRDLDARNARAVDSIPVTLAHPLLDTKDHLLRYVFPGVDVESFTTTEFIRCAFRASFPGISRSVSTPIAPRMISGTLVTAAVMFHTDAHNCPCDPEYLFEQEQFQIKVKRRLRLAIPHSQQPESRLLEVRVRYLFTLLESALTALDTPLESVISDVLRNGSVLAAVSCITASLDASLRLQQLLPTKLDFRLPEGWTFALQRVVIWTPTAPIPGFMD